MARTGTTTSVEIRCEDAGGATRLTALGASGLLRARALPSRDGVARVALVQTAASMLSGDHIMLTVDCGPGCRLELIEVAGMVAHDVRGGADAQLDMCVALGAGARMSWAARPLTPAAGCDLRRSVRVDLEDGAVLLWRDTLVLGRAGESPGRMAADLDVRRAGAELHAERLDTGDLELLFSPVVLGAGARVLDTLALYGARAPLGEGTLQLAGPGTIRPLPAPSLAAAARELDPLQARLRAELFSDDHPQEGTPDELRLAPSTAGDH
ncbi:MAG TPA: urease accessory protein UreD [Baekduia sp.]|nr:urease accessory protein UreD [Baekduia sp.]